MSLSGSSKSASAAVFRKNIAYFIEFFCCAGGLMYNQLVKGILILVKGIDAFIESIQSMCGSNDIIQSMESIEPYQVYRNLLTHQLLLLPDARHTTLAFAAKSSLE